MQKWLFLMLLAYVAWRWWGRSSRPTPPPARRAQGELMVRCAQCGVHFPQAEAVQDGDEVFCGEPHRQAWKQGR